jgi:3-hydroxybutyryl-CoA dehydrogenase
MKWRCDNCGFNWNFPVHTCIRCNVKTSKYIPDKYIVKGTTEVLSRSIEHNEVPYYVVLLEDNHGTLFLRKSFQKYTIGQEILEAKSEKYDLPRIGIVGTGVTAVGIAQVALLSGCKVILRGRSESSLHSAISKIEKFLSKRFSSDKFQNVMSQLTPAAEISQLSDADIVIEAIIEDLDKKRMIFKELDSLCGKRTILATNTSSLSIDEISKATQHPDRVIGLHFFNPIPKMRLVEIVYGSMTDQAVIDATKKVALALNKFPVIVKNSAGFIVNRLLMTFLSEAVQVLEEQMATRDDIDKAIELGLNHPMGPLKLLDLIGLDVFLSIMQNLHNYDPQKFKLSGMVKEMVSKEKLGRKTGEGFYQY